MIANERQYLITQAQAAKFRDALAAARKLTHKAVADALNLRVDIAP